MQERLPLAPAAGDFAGLTVDLHLTHVASDGLPALDLASILIQQSPTHVVAAVPLEPAARVGRV